MLKFILVLISALPACAQFLTYDANRRINFALDTTYASDDYHWFAHNTDPTSHLYHYSTNYSQESGNTDVRLTLARTVQAQGLPVATIYVADGHGLRSKAIAELASGVTCLLSSNASLTQQSVSQSISNYVAAGVRLFSLSIEVGNAPLVSNACRYVEMSNGLIFCSTPNLAVNIDTNADYPSFWADKISSIVPVSWTGRDGELVAGGAAWGTNVVAYPGRRIVCVTTTDGTNFSNGSSPATPLMAGTVGLLMWRHPNQTSAAYRQAITAACTPIAHSQRMDAMSLLEAPIPTLAIIGKTVTVHGLTNWNYAVEHTYNFTNWTHFTNRLGGQSFVAVAGFYRANCSAGVTNSFSVNEAFGANNESTGQSITDDQRQDLPPIFGGRR